MQQEIRILKVDINRKVDRHEITTLTGEVANLKHTIGELRTEINSFCSELQALQESKRLREEKK